MKVFILMVLVFCLAGCEQPQQASAEAEQLLRVGTNVWPGYEPLYLAREQEGWPGQNIRLIEYPSASEVLRAFRNKTLEAASLTLDEVMLLRNQGIPVTVVLVHDVSAGGDVIVARQGIDSMQALKGKRIGVEAGALGAYVLTRALEVNQMTLQDITIVNRDVNMHEAAMLNDEVDAVVTFEPVRTRLLQLGGEQVFDSTQIPNEIVDVLVVHQAVVQTHPQVISQLIDNWFDALAEMQRNPQTAASVMAKRLKISPQEVLQSYDGLRLPSIKENRVMLGGASPQLQMTAENLVRVMKEKKLLVGEIDSSNLFSDRFLPKE